MSSEGFIIGIIPGFLLGLGIALGIHVRYIPDGDRTESIECLTEQPNVCRTITIFTDIYKETK